VKIHPVALLHKLNLGMLTLLKQLGVELDKAENVKSDASKRTNISKVFTAGDMTRGQSLIVWAIAAGR